MQPKYLSVACPTCAQQPNEMCVGGQVHASRIEAWEFVEGCTGAVAPTDTRPTAGVWQLSKDGYITLQRG